MNEAISAGINELGEALVHAKFNGNGHIDFTVRGSS